ncbi:hypothetical protein TrLO_g16019 [Triparma laevis f. longispina]|uniref:Peptidyl-prolyl cis-trans isomerase n=2 Tax=Triparma laevis TaxID=1534972 RepID=A0A9W7BZ41_9STRA|nr:hypothetical protein TrLO_g16019 [Triparma laevis f. longispina]
MLLSLLLLVFVAVSVVDSFVPAAPQRVAFVNSATRSSAPSQLKTQLNMGFMDDLQGFVKKFTSSASASHILIKSDDGFSKLEKIKADVGNDPIKFAEAASEFSACPSRAKGGALGTFKPGQMVKEFNEVVFNDEVGVVHGPIKTQFGYHLIMIDERSD